ncbi:PEP-CTERM sorting domain-containing protein [Paraglaciecola sp. MB-3u-78]|uniref:PEP-CTERM sorting domain-containing protein n=1 Tax=Paraglaciecola sp. MB-3u-78 TaxID=2058332 RepID=UPI000C346F29|nr:PEP-CTERM sorting domain-containing protein [Paraglaciecola sp. MB-3u-78]PKG98768.1 hypothetical protein CXF95_12975 [Paraglaciecola sp. MB-3u-78]
MNIQAGIKYIALGAIFLASASSYATIIAFTDFNDKTASGATASNLNWTINGISDPLSLTATKNLNLNSAAEDMFAVDYNLFTEGSWSVDIALNVLAVNNIALSTVSLNAYIFSNSDILQSVSRDLDLNLSLFSGASLLADVNELNIYASGGPVVQGQAVSFDLSGNTLLAGNDYFLRLTASTNIARGNNAGFDNLNIEGLIQAVSVPIPVPEPSLLAIFGLGIMLIGARRYK